MMRQQLNDAILGYFRGTELAQKLPIAHNHHTVAHFHDFREFGRNHDHRQPCCANSRYQAVDFGFCTDIDPPLGSSSNNILGWCQPLRQDDFLLVASRKGFDLDVRRRGFDIQRIDESFDILLHNTFVDITEQTRMLRRFAIVMLSSRSFREDPLFLSLFGDHPGQNAARRA